ncbi:hypothetical protein Ping_3100 [Psychromonas ingrahamii 37]|uniref:Orc1-like AAA ATPase domain-containing protein n=1 Tax=Psychromonas ingrahamii (strain DSM 17664 / CCUG 51855 / 37) TaxID=357804 RepID=A1SZ82_PSYIN|nr:tetratricopeptide repeat protein [Psychromonas ingrahamii]ABM04797.1 hypothetical protein Ping_3100 [Psychromonas ingrahamii 37]
MPNLKLANNYQADLVKSQNTPLLIELNKNDISNFDNQLDNSIKAKFPFLVAQKIYDDELSNNTTNIIAIDCDSYQQDARFYLLEALLDQLSLELKDIKNIITLKEVLKTGASVATGGLLTEFVGTYLDKGVDYVFEEVGDYFSKLLVDTVTENINVSNLVIGSIEGFIQETTGDSLGDFIGNTSDHQLQLSATAKTELNTLSKAFAESAKHDVFQLTFKILLAISLDSPKLIYINNPHKLDNNSLAILSLLLSYAKHQKDADKHVGLSVVYTYNDQTFQPYCEVADDLKQKQRLLDDQRRFSQRYAMLERPSSDIPKVAVKSSLFVGRTNELAQLQANFEQCDGLTVSVVSGEPGIGKTALVNKHLEQIEESKMIRLTLLNEVGHSSSNTGLSSLEKSILEEATRLELLKGWRDKGVGFFKALATKDNAVKAIGTIFNGAEKALNIAMTGHERLMVDSNIDSMKRGGVGDLDNKKSNQKEQQFNNLDKAINTLLPLSDQNLPLVLFIDDCQWIDNSACEYILTCLAKKVQLYIVSTIRPSDAATLLKQLLENPALHEYSIALLKAIETNGHQAITTTIDTSFLTHSTINLTGFDKKALNELISQVIKGKTAQLDALTNTIFSEIAGHDAMAINTLFAIESINMLCDDKLYSENETTRLIVDNPLRINSEITDVSEAIKETFAILQSKYKDSLSHYEKSAGQDSFNLMAYAVLEERLHLLKLYFGGHGNAALNTLLFSSLLGAPFSSTIVTKVLEALAETEEPLLDPLKAHINQSQQEVGLTSEHYAIIDEVYEILSRYTPNDDKYKYRHALLHIFLDKQLEHLLDTLLTEKTTQAKEQMLELMLEVINQEEKQQRFYDKPEQSLNTTDYELMLFFKNAQQNILRKGFEINADTWAERYTASLKESMGLTKGLYRQNPVVWAERYSSSLSNLAMSYKDNNQLPQAITLQEELLCITKALYQNNATVWAERYTIRRNNLAMSYKNNNQQPQAIALQDDELLSTAKALPLQNPTVCATAYTSGLNNSAVSYKKNNQLPQAITLEEESLSITKALFQQNPKVWVADYTTSLNNLAMSYKNNNQLPQAIALEEESLSITKALR